MSTLVLPAEVQAGIQVERGKALHSALQDHDPNLELVFIKETIPEAELPWGTIPGRWHVRQHINLGAPRYYPITQPDGSYREPDFGVLEEMRARDLQHRRLDDVIPRTRDPKVDGPTKEDQLRDEQRRDEMAADVRTAKRVAGEDVFKRNWGKGGKKK